MSHRQVSCVGCDGAFTVEEDQEESRCVSCGTKYAGPWDDPVILSSPILDDAEIQRANARGDVEPRTTTAGGPSESEAATDGGRDAIEIDAAEGQTVEIVIRIR